MCAVSDGGRRFFVGGGLYYPVFEPEEFDLNGDLNVGEPRVVHHSLQYSIHDLDLNAFLSPPAVPDDTVAATQDHDNGLGHQSQDSAGAFIGSEAPHNNNNGSVHVIRNAASATATAVADDSHANDTYEENNEEELSQVLGILQSWCHLVEQDQTSTSIEALPPAKRIKLDPHSSPLKQDDLLVKKTLFKVKPTLEILGATDHTSSNHQQAGEEGQHMCSICFDEITKGIEIVKMVRCHHVLHRCCIFKWLPRKQTCPYCQLSSLTNVYIWD